MASPWVRECVFRFKCPLSWDGLSRTADERVRHCSECDRDVFLTETDKELEANASLGRCVAVESEGRAIVGEAMPTREPDSDTPIRSFRQTPS